ncbi:uncharacterized protein PHACADRAFT_203855 [Phanerochaete carnosa HHB-10118-sp]|uniref:Autophagy-related protein 14 n=1 Tax=Phanerochaete carnosa (strain HHB-10118-sp) TaxID=650164 RepID=K5WMN1_PHACS|nr:uncharacterized protein PHACADRAFT_203855 [Phanerochaete carnosa HHB-10118-sp]EKM60705.1 hypothetical protein PHACADRAFT_203855 [Phanerochaete carnosa HHB-10118-sp]
MLSETGRPKEGELVAPRRVRHITSIQVRNLTPFPIRDEAASALVLPSEQPQFTPHGNLSDDLDVTLARKRGRRKSYVSAQTLFSNELSGADGSPSLKESLTKRQRAASRASVTTSPNLKGRPNGPPPTARPTLRARTPSMASSISNFSSSVLEPATSSTPFSGLLRDTSQPALERVLQSRLVETFLTVTIPPTCDSADESDLETLSSAMKDTKSQSNSPQPPRRNTTIASGSNGVPKLADPMRRGSLSKGTSARITSGHHRAMSSSAASLTKVIAKPSAPQTLPRSMTRDHALSRLSSTSAPHLSTLDPAPPKDDFPVIPDYLSPIHQPSINPSFSIDARSHFDFAQDTDLSMARMSVEIWGKVVDPKSSRQSNGKGKEKARYADEREVVDQGGEWKVLERWDVNLNDLIPLQNNIVHYPSRLPPNTLCVTLDPLGQTFYLPSLRSSLSVTLPSRSSSPETGYNSDGESGIRRKFTAKSSEIPAPNVKANELTPDLNDLRMSLARRHGSERKSVTWQDLFKLVTLQAVIQDTAKLLSDVVRDIDKLVTTNDVSTLTREASERNAWVKELRREVDNVEQCSRTLKERLQAKREDLRIRRQILAEAREVHDEDLQQEVETEALFSSESQRLIQLRHRISPMQNMLISTLAFIFPIDLLSPPDLLFTILDVPLPIPNAPMDPAPPLSLSSHKEINEETVATALGFAAQAVQLLAAYLGIRLTYPVTCVGGRSLIKDSISHMVGPRMFPLFSKGVDTYRFEYAVFLLNKDIELLMTERNLRALDMRHTLPNLKNLLLTLTNPDTLQTTSYRPPSVASTTISALQSPVFAPSTLPAVGEPASFAPTDSVLAASEEDGSDGEPASGAVTPTKMPEPVNMPTSTVRKSKGFLDLTPLSGFFKRNPSSSRGSAKAEPPLDDDQTGEATPTMASTSTPVASPASAPELAKAQAEGSGSGDDEDDSDRRTIRASTSGDGAEENKQGAKIRAGRVAINGNGTVLGHGAQVGEKIVEPACSPSVVDGVS